jgi:Divergent InlB B-repeat domain
MARRLGSWGLVAALAALALGFGTAGARSTASTTLLVQVIGRGVVVADGGQINCGGGSKQCYFETGSGATIKLTVTADSGWSFAGWESGSDDCVGFANPCTVVLAAGDNDENLVDFTQAAAPGTNTLTVNVTGDSDNNGGTVAGGDGEIDCTPAETGCTWETTTGSTLTVLQTPESGYDFTGWGGPCSGSARSCTVQLDSDETVNASFAKGASTHTLTVSVTGNGTVTGAGGGISCTSTGGSGCTATVDANASVTLTATPGAGAGFTAWGGACSGSNTSCTFTITGNTSVSAAFSGTGSGGGGGGGTTFPLTVSVTGTGRVSGGGIDCGNGNTTCSVNLASGTTVNLAAAASGQAEFKGWGGACSGTSASCSVTMTAARSVTATFAPTGQSGSSNVKLTLRVQGKGTVSASGGTCASSGKPTTCNQSYDTGTDVTLTATPQAGASFTGWSGACSGSELTCTITLDQATTVTATFSGARTPAAAGAALRSRGHPIVRRTASGFRVTLRFTTTKRGTAHVRALRAGRVQTALAFTIAPGIATIGPFPVIRPGFYAFELTLAGRSLRWTACLGRCGAAAHARPFALSRGPARVLDSGALWSVSVHFHATLPSGALIRIYRSGRLVRATRFPLAAGDVSAGPFLLSPGTYRLRLTATDAYGRTRTLSWYAFLS